MIAIFLDDTFYLIDNMDMKDVVAIANEEGLGSPKLRAKAVMQSNKDFYNSAMVKGLLPEVSWGFYETGDKYIMKPVMDIGDLEYFIGPDGRKYACESAYHNSPHRFVGVNPDVEELDVAAEVVSSDVPAQPDLQAGKDADGIGGEELIPSFRLSQVGVNPLLSDKTGNYGKIDEEKLENAEFLDSFISKYPKISMYIKDEHLAEVSHYLSDVKEDLDREVKFPYLEEAKILSIIGDSNEPFMFQNAIGTSNSILDSLLTFPVFSALVGKKNLTERFSLLNLSGAQFVRICPVGVGEDGHIYGFVHMEEISVSVASKVEQEIRQELKKSQINFNKLTAREKYDLFEKKVYEHYTKSSGKMLRASGSQKYVDIVEFLNNMLNKKYVVPNFYDDDDERILWASHEFVAFDNRGPKTLKDQLLAHYESADYHQETSFPESPKILEEVPSQAETLVVDLLAPAYHPAKRTEEVAKDDKESAVKMSLFEILAQNAGQDVVDSLTVRDSKGQVLGKVEAPKKAPVGHKMASVVEGSVTMGGVDPMVPQKYIDADGRTWESKEKYDQVMRALFGDDEPEQLGEGAKKK